MASQWLTPPVQLQRAVDAIDAFVVPRMPLHVAQVQETQPKPPGLAGVGQAGQQIGDLAAIGLEPMAPQWLASRHAASGHSDSKSR